MSDAPLEPVIEEIIREGERIRILVVGKTGVGKTSLIKETFKVETLEPAHNHVGISDIQKEIISPDNDRFVIHDSHGYEPGDKKKYERLMSFVETRCGETKLSDRLHVIWLCIEVPYAGGRVLERGTENLLQSIPEDIALVVVFTKYDQLVEMKEYDILQNNPDIEDDALASRCRVEAEEDFNKHCISVLKKFSYESGCRLPPMVKVSVESPYQTSLSDLVKVTEDRIKIAERYREEALEGSRSGPSENPLGSTSLSLMAMAQRVDMDSKVDLAIRVGKKKYWRGLASSTHFPGLGLHDCLAVLHKDIVIPWNIIDPNKLLLSKEFESSITQLVGDLEKLSDAAARKAMSRAVALAGTISGVAGAAAGPVAPIVAPSVFLGVFFAHWVYDTYTTTPHTVRCLMAYIIHLTNVMQRIFYGTLQGRSVSKKSIDEVVKNYSTSEVFGSLCASIVTFVTSTKTFQFADRDCVLDEIVRLIHYHRFVPQEDS